MSLCYTLLVTIYEGDTLSFFQGSLNFLHVDQKTSVLLPELQGAVMEDIHTTVNRQLYTSTGL